MRKGAEVANHSSKYKEEKKKRHRRKGKTKEDKRFQKHKMRKTVKNKHKRKNKTSLHIHIRKRKHRTLKNSLTVHAAHTQNVRSLICILHLWLMHLQMQGRNTNTSGAGKKKQKEANTQQACNTQHTWKQDVSACAHLSCCLVLLLFYLCTNTHTQNHRAVSKNKPLTKKRNTAKTKRKRATTKLACNSRHT